VEQPRVLEHHAEQLSEPAACHPAGIDPVERDPPAVELVEPQQQVHERGLAGAGRADDRDRLPGRDVQIQVLDQRDVRQVPERDVGERDVTLGGPEEDRVGDVGLFLGLVEELEDALGARHRGLQDVHDRGRLRDRHRELTGVLDERLDVAERSRPFATMSPPTTQIAT
jgi:hypothetical protein